MDWGSTAENHGGGKAYVLSQKKAQEEMKNRTTGMAKPGKRMFLRQAVLNGCTVGRRLLSTSSADGFVIVRETDIVSEINSELGTAP